MKKLSSFFFVSLFLGAFFLTSCQEQPTREPQPEPVVNDASTLGFVEKAFPNDLSFYNQLMQDPNCTVPLIQSVITGNIGCSDFKAGVIRFYDDYKSTPTLNYFPSKLTLAPQHISLIQNLATQTNYGLVFHYGYTVLTPAGGAPEGNILYILGKGKLDANVNIIDEPFGDNENGQNFKHYIVIANSANPIRFINETEFETLTCAYRNNVTYKGTLIKDLDTSINHPLKVYHAPAEFSRFYNGQGSGSNSTLYISHGSILSSGLTSPMHTPLFILGNDTLFNVLDNSGGGGTPNTRYLNQALDVGRLCPPHCNSAAPSC